LILTFGAANSGGEYPYTVFVHLSQNFSVIDVKQREGIVDQSIHASNDSLVLIVCHQRQPTKAVQSVRFVKKQSQSIDVQPVLFDSEFTFLAGSASLTPSCSVACYKKHKGKRDGSALPGRC
jgi:hypothetical protein